ILTQKAAGAAMITASHNPWTDNGYKYKPEYAGSADPVTIAAIEKEVAGIYGTNRVQRTDLQSALDAGAVRYFSVAPTYLERLGELIELDALKKSGLKVVVDPMFGSGQTYFPRLLDGGELRLTEINAER